MYVGYVIDRMQLRSTFEYTLMCLWLQQMGSAVRSFGNHYSDVIMDTMASQIANVSVVCIYDYVW